MSEPDARPVVAVTYRGAGETLDGILDYSRRLTRAIDQAGRLGAVLVEGDPAGWRVDGGAPVPKLPAAIEPADALLLQYNPFSYGRRGFAPWLLRDLRHMRRHGLPIGVMVHEAFLHAGSWRQAILSTWQKVQLRTLLGHADVAFASTEAVVRQAERLRPRLGVHHLPVASNLPDRRAARAGMRAQLGLGDDDVALVAFRTGHPSQLGPVVSRAARAAAGRSTAVLNLGAGAPPMDDLPAETRVLSPGRLEEDELAAWLAAGDLFIAPFSDGASTRRTTMMAAFQHELAVVATSGHNTDRILHERPDSLTIVDPAEPGALERAVERLVEDPDARRAMGLAGRRLFQERFDWPVIAGRVADALAEAWPGVPVAPPRG